MKLEEAWNGLHLGVDDEINYNVAVPPFNLFGEK